MTSKQRRWLLVLAGVAVAIALAGYLGREREPSYQGQPLSHWIEAYAKVVNTIQHDDHDSADAIRHIGTNGLPWLLKWTRYRPPPQGLSVIKTIVGILPNAILPRSVRNWVETDSWSRAEYAVFAFEPLGGTARVAIPELTSRTNDTSNPTNSFLAIWALTYVGPDSLPTLINQLTNTNAPNRSYVARLISNAPVVESDSIVPVLVQCLDDPDKAVAESAAYSIGWLVLGNQQREPPATLMVPALMKCLHADVQSDMRKQAMYALGKYGRQAHAAIPLLLEATADPNAEQRIEATNALRKIAPEVLSRRGADPANGGMD